VKVVSANSGAAILNKQYQPEILVASVAVLVEPPYREPSMRVAEAIFREVDNNLEVIVHEAELCQKLLEKTKGDIVHLDMTLGGVTIEDLSPVELFNMRTSKAGRQNIIKILPRLRRVAGEIKRLYGIDMLAIGKESVPVRIAELTAGAEAILFSAEKAIEDGEDVLLGLPLNCQPTVLDDRIILQSLIAGEHDLRSFTNDREGILAKVKLTETLNPIARGFRALKIAPKQL
jgi:hypothetical protein